MDTHRHTAAMDEDASAGELREAMVAELRSLGVIRSESVARAVATVPRHLFAPGEPLDRAYTAKTILASKVDGHGVAVSMVSAADIQAMMLEQAEIEPGMRVLEIGGLDLAVLAVLGGHVAWVADNDPACDRLLAVRWPGVPNLGDITGVDWSAVPRVDVVTAGFPCQDISHAGHRRGISGPRSGIWRAVADAIGVLRPGLVFVENVAALRNRGLDRVLTDLAALRYDATWLCLRASDVAAAHRRDRLFLLATPDRAHPADPVRP